MKSSTPISFEVTVSRTQRQRHTVKNYSRDTRAQFGFTFFANSALQGRLAKSALLMVQHD